MYKLNMLNINTYKTTRHNKDCAVHLLKSPLRATPFGPSTLAPITVCSGNLRTTSHSFFMFPQVGLHCGQPAISLNRWADR